MDECVHVKVAGVVATVTLNRPERHNALDERLIANLTQAFQKLGVADLVRVIILQGEGKSFCAGADLGQMQRVAGQGREENMRDAMALAILMDAINRCPKPVIALVQGAALGGGVGLVAAADMAIASQDASFALTEVRLGLEPAVISPLVVAALGARACRRYMLTGERFDARDALRLGLVHGVVALDQMDGARDHLVEACLKGAPGAQAACKDLIRLVSETENGPDLMRATALRLAERRESAEARDGLEAFSEKREPSWRW